MSKRLWEKKSLQFGETEYVWNVFYHLLPACVSVPKEVDGLRPNNSHTSNPGVGQEPPQPRVWNCLEEPLLKSWLLNGGEPPGRQLAPFLKCCAAERAGDLALGAGENLFRKNHLHHGRRILCCFTLSTESVAEWRNWSNMCIFLLPAAVITLQMKHWLVRCPAGSPWVMCIANRRAGGPCAQ